MIATVPTYVNNIQVLPEALHKHTQEVQKIYLLLVEQENATAAPNQQPFTQTATNRLCGMDSKERLITQGQ